MDEFRPAPVKPTVGIADLEKLDVRVGTILAVADGIRPALAVPERPVPNGVRAG